MFFKPDLCFNDRETKLCITIQNHAYSKNRLNNASNRTQRGAYSVSLLKLPCICQEDVVKDIVRNLPCMGVE
jgi:hypothetical protein